MNNSQRFWRGFFFVFMIAALCAGLALPAVSDIPAFAAPQMQTIDHIVISQVYGGGGTTGALYQYDFVEIFNPTNNPIPLDGLSVQFARANNSDLFSDNVLPLSGSLDPGQYYLVQLNSSGAVGSPLPAADITGIIDLGTANGKVILVNGITGLPCNGSRSAPCSAYRSQIIDRIGYGSASFYEGGAAAPKLSNITADLRTKNGCQDNNNNAADFAARTPAPRNSTDTPLNCSDLLTATASAVNATSTAAREATRISRRLTRTARAAYMSVIINEVAWGGTLADSADEWIELYNPGSDPIDLDGWVLMGAGGTPTIDLTGMTIQGRNDPTTHGFFLLERGDDTVANITADKIYSGALANADESLQLLDGDGRLIDTANKNGGSWPAGDDSPGYYSMERRGVVRDSNTAWITNNNSASWIRAGGHDARCNPATPSTCTTSNLIRGTPRAANWAISVTPTPTRTITRTRTPTPTRTRTRTPTPPPPPPLVAINEFVPRPGHDWNLDGVINTDDEYIEILNHGVIDVNLSGYRLDDEANIGSEPFALPSVTLKPGERIVFYGSETGLLLSDGGDGVRLLRPNGQLVDAYNYFVVRFPDQSYCRLPDNGGLDDWNQNCFPTPGLQNSLSGSVLNPPTSGNASQLCPIADTLPDDFLYAECPPFGNIWNREYWDRFGWFDEKYLPGSPGKWPLFAD